MKTGMSPRSICNFVYLLITFCFWVIGRCLFARLAFAPCPLLFLLFLLKPDECTYSYGIFAAGRTFEALHPPVIFLQKKQISAGVR